MWGSICWCFSQLEISCSFLIIGGLLKYVPQLYGHYKKKCFIGCLSVPSDSKLTIYLWNGRVRDKIMRVKFTTFKTVDLDLCCKRIFFHCDSLFFMFLLVRQKSRSCIFTEKKRNCILFCVLVFCLFLVFKVTLIYDGLLVQRVD